MPSSPSFAPSQPPKVRELLETDAQLTSVGVAEVLDHLVRVVGADEEEATLDLAQLGLLEGTVVGSTVGRTSWPRRRFIRSGRHPQGLQRGRWSCSVPRRRHSELLRRRPTSPSSSIVALPTGISGKC